MRFILLSLALSGVSAFAPSMHKPALSTLSTQSAPASPLFRKYNKVSSTARCALETAEMPDKLYFKKEKELPKVLGGLKIGLRELVVITGASSGLGLNCASTLAKTGKYFVVMAVRDVEKAKQGTWGHSGVTASLTYPLRMLTNSHSPRRNFLQWQRKWVCPIILTSP